MALEIPAWLAQRKGSLKLTSDKRTWFVMIEREPQYSLVAVPATGNFNCVVRQTISGARLESSGTYPTADDAVRGGLDDLRKALGW